MQGRILDLMMEVFFEFYPQGQDSIPPPPFTPGEEFDAVCDEIYQIAVARYFLELEGDDEVSYVH